MPSASTFPCISLLGEPCSQGAEGLAWLQSPTEREKTVALCYRFLHQASQEKKRVS